MVDKIKIQSSLVLLVTFIFAWFSGAWFAILLGGLVSIINSIFLYWHTKNQKSKLTLTAKASVNLMIKSVLTRFSLVVCLVLFGFWSGLSALAFITGFFIGQVGFILDKFIGVNGR